MEFFKPSYYYILLSSNKFSYKIRLHLNENNFKLACWVGITDYHFKGWLELSAWPNWLKLIPVKYLKVILKQESTITGPFDPFNILFHQQLLFHCTVLYNNIFWVSIFICIETKTSQELKRCLLNCYFNKTYAACSFKNHYNPSDFFYF